MAVLLEALLSVQPVSLADVLRVLEPEAAQLAWSVLELEATGDLSSRGGMLAFEERVNASPTGVQLSWSELVELAHQLDQVIDGTFVGYPPGAEAPRRAEASQLRLSSAVALEAHDSTVWWLYVRDDGLGQRLSAALPRAQLVDPAADDLQ